MMRALAHPARIAIWTHLGLRGSATATECAGFVEEDPASAADGRERPWRARMLAFNIEDSPGTPAVTRVASRLMVESLRAAAEKNRARYVARQSEYPDDWQAASGELFSVAHVTPEERDGRDRVARTGARHVRRGPHRRPARWSWWPSCSG